MSETTAAAAAKPTTEPAVPGATGESPAPRPVERNVDTGAVRNARAELLR